MSDTKEEHTVASTLADPQYKAGRKLIDDGRLEEAVNFFSGLLETRVAVLSGNEMCPALAPLYYEYGNSLLYNAEESGAVFGDAITEVEKKKAMAIVDAQLHEAMQPEENGGGTEDGGGGAGGSAGGGAEEGDGNGAAAPTPDQEAEEDLEIAWENLEMARRIYSELELTEEVRVPFAKVHLRLGDLNMVNGMYNEAADEFEKCLEHRLAMPNPVSRGVADAHVRRAQALFYASTLEGADKDTLVASSLEQYRLAAGIFEAMLKSMSAPPATPTPTPTATPCASPGKENNGEDSAESSSEKFKGKGKGKGKGTESSSEEPPADAAVAAPLASGSAEELQDVLDAIRETIDTMVSGKDMEALAEYKNGAVSTTVGFGDAGGGGGGSGGGEGAASEKGVAGEVTTIGFGAPAAAGVGGAAALAGFGSSAGGGGVGASTAFSSSGFGGGAVAPTANVMVVKRKGRPTPKVAPTKVATVTANGVGGGQESEGGDTAKKAKSNS